MLNPDLGPLVNAFRIWATSSSRDESPNMEWSAMLKNNAIHSKTFRLVLGFPILPRRISYSPFHSPNFPDVSLASMLTICWCHSHRLADATTQETVLCFDTSMISTNLATLISKGCILNRSDMTGVRGWKEKKTRYGSRSGGCRDRPRRMYST